MSNFCKLRIIKKQNHGIERLDFNGILQNEDTVLIDTLLEGIQPKNTEKKEFEYQKRSILLGYFEMYFRLSEIKRQAQNNFGAKFPLLM